MKPRENEEKSPPSKNEAMLERALEKAYARAVGSRLARPEDFHGLLSEMFSAKREWVH